MNTPRLGFMLGAMVRQAEILITQVWAHSISLHCTEASLVVSVIFRLLRIVATVPQCGQVTLIFSPGGE